MDPSKILFVIPARGGSKGIARKNLRLLGGKPLIHYSISNILNIINSVSDVVVSSDDDEILMVSQRLGAFPIKRDETLSHDSATLDGVIYHALKFMEEHHGKSYDLIATIQPTSPLLSGETLEDALTFIIENKDVDTLISVKEDKHLGWVKINGKLVPDYEKRLNRQELPDKFKETGGFFITRRSCITENNRIGPHVNVYELEGKESIDIDSFEDWALCEYYLKRRRIVIVTSGYREIGLGHIYNTLAIANGIVDHEVIFVVDNQSDQGYKKIKENNYRVIQQGQEEITETIASLNPDIIINDRLDTSLFYMETLKSNGYKIINFEDLGEGTSLADLVINAMYPEQSIVPNHYYGHEYFCLRNEFLHIKSSIEIKENVDRIIVTFGGVDPNNYTQRILTIIQDYCQDNNIIIDVILGLGYKKMDSLSEFINNPNINIYSNVSNISEFMLKADVAITSAGRTTFETASIGLPTIVLCQNERETTHFFAYSKYGFENLGLGYEISDNKILNSVEKVIENYSVRKHMSDLMNSFNIRNGRDKVLKLIKKVIES